MGRFFSVIILIFCSQVVTAQAKPISDGPYIFYEGDEIISQVVVDGVVHKTILKRSDSNRIIVPVPSGSFTVTLRSKIEPPPAEYKNPEKVFATSDIEGNFTAFKNLLVLGGVIDEEFNWTYGKGHLVLAGDLFDRGNEVTSCLWLLYKLEDEAKASGGGLHVILGNHEIMNLNDDIRYVHPKYLEVATLLGRTYMDFYAPNTELGRWIRSRNIIEKIGSSLFLHAGISQTVNDLGLSLKNLNNKVRPYYDQDAKDSLLISAGVDPFFWDKTSPFWYRGYFVAPLASMEQVDSTLSLYNVKRVVVGHTLVDNIKTFYKGKVVAIDVNHHAGNHQALLLEKDNLFVLTMDGKKTRLQ
jgi:hypothetical protein